MRQKLLILSLALGLLTAPFICAQNKNAPQNSSSDKDSGNMITVEQAYLNSIEGVMIKEMVAAEGRDSKLVALQYIENALNEGRKTEEIQAALSSLATTGLSTVIREDGRVINNYPDIRRRACELLGQMGTDEAKDVLVAVMYTDNEPSVITAAVKSLGTIGKNNNDEVSDMINWIARKFDTVNPTSSLALEILNTFERMAGSISNKKDMFETIMRIANNYSYVTPVRTKAHEVMRAISNADGKGEK
ncbi:MAG: HEAT repeat domain-containing protein [Treponema sp.]